MNNINTNELLDQLNDLNIFCKNGKLNGINLKKIPQNILEIINKITDYLDIYDNVKLKHRIKAIKLNLPQIIKCPICGDKTCLLHDSNTSIFTRFCSDLCASQFARTDQESITKLKKKKNLKVIE